MESEIESPAPDGRSSIRVQAVLALIRGEPAAQVSAQFDRDCQDKRVLQSSGSTMILRQ